MKNGIRFSFSISFATAYDLKSMMIVESCSLFVHIESVCLEFMNGIFQKSCVFRTALSQTSINRG